MYRNDWLRTSLFVVMALFCLSPWVSAPVALVSGFLFSLLCGNPFARYTAAATNRLLKISVIGLGFGINVDSAVAAGNRGLVLTICSITGVLVLGFFLGRIFKISPKTTHLISSGTAICGGSAIAAVAPVIDAGEKDISVSLGAIFALNALALIIFPFIGHLLNMSQSQFGLWCAVAIHDTSSVVGAATTYGKEALNVATTVKLERALWIIPLSLLSAFFFKSKSKKIKIPWFIGLFVLAMLINSYLPLPEHLPGWISTGAKSTLVLTLFLIGSGLDVQKIKAVGWKPFVLAVALWLFIGTSSLWLILHL